MCNSLVELNWCEVLCSLGFALAYLGAFICALARDYD